ncbi:hypothetical protein HY949_02455 [Candidatus Gottesmanbacteria bacterium]|nr:hypothetical protein [Candidatus Gottesmanbacteria bacterium]
MDGLPTASDAGNNPIRTNITNNLPQSGIHDAVIPIQSGTASGQSSQLGGTSIGKELEQGGVGLEQPGLKDVSGREIELPKEVSAVGVSTQPTTVQIPQSVANMGVKAVGDAVVPIAPPSVLPLTDDQIALGLKQSVTSSWRWLAEFCVRRLKQLHMTIKGIGGKTVRVDRK